MCEKRRDFNLSIFWYSSLNIGIVWNLFHLGDIFNSYRRASRCSVSFAIVLKDGEKVCIFAYFKRINIKYDIIEDTY